MYREKYITVVQSLHTPPSPHGSSSGKQQGGWTRTDIYHCECTWSNILSDYYFKKLLKQGKLDRKKTKNHDMATHKHIPHSSKKCRREGKSSILKRTYLIIRWTVWVICEFSTATKSFRWYPHKEIIKPRGSRLGNVAWFRYQCCSRYLQCYGARYAESIHIPKFINK
jgi:hypothetical protein